MRTLVLSVVFVSSLVGGTVAAESAFRSEYFYQPYAHNDELTPNLSVHTTKSDYKSGSTGSTSATELGLRYERGLNDILALGADVGFEMGHTQTSGAKSRDISGLNDISFLLRGVAPMTTAGALTFGATLNTSLGAHEISSDESSPNNGGTDLVPYIGYQWLLGRPILGVKFQSAFDVVDESWNYKDTGEHATVHGGHRTGLSAFYESQIERTTLGGSVEYWGDSTQRGLNTSRNTNFSTSGQAGYALTAYARYTPLTNTDILGEVLYEKVLTDHGSVDDRSEIGVIVGGRFTY